MEPPGDVRPQNVEVSLTYWVGFFALVGVVLFLDLFFHRKAKRIRFREALGWSTFWVSLAVAFNVWIYIRFGPAKGAEFTTGYLIEEALSIDNLFVFIVIFRYFRIPPEYQHRILFWGILGAILMRFAFIFLGIELIERFHFMVYLFGGLLILTGLKLLTQDESKIDPERNLILRLFRRWVPTTDRFEGPRFLVKREGRTYATPLLLVLLVVESTDVVFAVDSVPAILAITVDRFIVFTSNVFAILGLRSFYFLLAGIMDLFRFLKVGLSLILMFVGAKMILAGADLVKIPVVVSLGVIAGVLATSILASVVVPHRPREPEEVRGEVGLLDEEP